MPITPEMGAMPPTWVIYFGVADLDASLARVQELGGAIVAGPLEHAGYRYAMVQDPQGAMFYIMR
jgi:predicted enzyme related to lactoylglutathione lyase